jgi:hypothetical protein
MPAVTRNCQMFRISVENQLRRHDMAASEVASSYVHGYAVEAAN